MLIVKEKERSSFLATPKVVFEDNHLLVLDKPAGWVVNVAKTTIGQQVLQSWLAQNYNYPLAKNRENRSGIVHRLDKETSGILVVAKRKEAYDNLQKQFRERVVEKTYIALVHGKVSPEKGIIEAPVGRLPWRRDRFGVLPGGRSAKTSYKVIAYYLLDDACYTLLELYPKTGRTHQIRIHMKYINHPVVGDAFYAGRKTARKDRTWCPRLFLHANKLGFFHPFTFKKLTFESVLTQDLQSVLGLFNVK